MDGLRGGAVVGDLAGAGEDEDGDLGVAEDADLPGLLDDPIPPLREGHLPIRRVLDPLDLDLPSTHLDFLLA